MTSNLKNLIGLLHAFREGPDADSPDLAPLLREGAELAGQLARIIEALPQPAHD